MVVTSPANLDELGGWHRHVYAIGCMLLDDYGWQHLTRLGSGHGYVDAPFRRQGALDESKAGLRVQDRSATLSSDRVK